jgi:hypothetical protein
MGGTSSESVGPTHVRLNDANKPDTPILLTCWHNGTMLALGIA